MRQNFSNFVFFFQIFGKFMSTAFVKNACYLFRRRNWGKMKSLITFLFFGRRAKNFQQGCPKFLLRVWKIFFILIFLKIKVQHFHWILSKKISTGLSKLYSACPDEHFVGKYGKKRFYCFFWNWGNLYWLVLSKLRSTRTEQFLGKK